MAKLLLCCGKAKPYLYYNWNTDTYHVTNSLKDLRGDFGGSRVCSGADRLCAYQDDGRILTNGHIMAECDFEVDEIKYLCSCKDGNSYATRKSYLNLEDLCRVSCLSSNELENYLGNKDGYAVHIKNLHIFDKPKELFDYSRIIETPYGEEPDKDIKKTPKTMIPCCYLEIDIWKKAFILSRTPQELCRILNGKQTIIVRKKVLKEMLNNG